MAKSIVLKGPVEHDGKVYAEGDEFPAKASKEAIAALVAVGVIGSEKPVEKPAEQTEGDPPPA